MWPLLIFGTVLLTFGQAQLTRETTENTAGSRYRFQDRVTLSNSNNSPQQSEWNQQNANWNQQNTNWNQENNNYNQNQDNSNWNQENSASNFPNRFSNYMNDQNVIKDA